MKLGAHVLVTVAAVPVWWEEHIAVKLVLLQGNSQPVAATRDSSEEDGLIVSNWSLRDR